METFEAIESRRSIRRFKEYEITSNEINQLLNLAVLSPTSYNIQNWRFVIVKNQSLKDKLCKFSYGQRQVAEASLVIILCADLKAWNKSPERYCQNNNDVADAIRRSYKNNETLERDEAFRSCGMAAQTIMLAARSMKYDTCPMEGFSYDDVAKLINLPSDHIITMMITIGKKNEEPSPRAGQLELSEVVFENSF